MFHLKSALDFNSSANSLEFSTSKTFMTGCEKPKDDVKENTEQKQEENTVAQTLGKTKIYKLDILVLIKFQFNYFVLIAACAAARRAIGTLNGEHVSRDDAGKFLNSYYDTKIYENDPFAKIVTTSFTYFNSFTSPTNGIIISGIML